MAWLTVDDDDNNVVWFLTHLLESIRRVRPELAESLGPALEEHGEDAERYVLTSLIDEIHGGDHRIAVVIDDWHRVTDTRTIAALGFLLDNGCHHLQIIVTSWSQSGLPLSKMRIRDELVEIDSTALRFDAEEARSFFSDVGGLELSRRDVDALTTSTDGWVAALQLASLSLRGDDDAASLLGRLSGRNDVIGEFLAENVLDTLEPEILDFLLLTSITERTCAGLASALANVARGQAMLEEVERRGLFLQHIDDDWNWFRYHQMFAEFLRRRLERDRPDQIEHLHRTASGWFAEHGYLNDAVDHALAAGDPARAVDLVEQDETNLIEQGKMTTLLGIVGKLPPQLVVSRARLQLLIAWANILLQRPAPTYAALDRFETAVERADLSDAARADLRAEANVVREHRRDIRRSGRNHRCFGVRGVIEAGHTASPGRRSSRQYRCRRGDLPFRLRRGASIPGVGRALPRDDGSVRRHLRALQRRHRREISARHTAAMKEFRQAYQMAAKGGAHSHGVRLAGALLGELLYETGELTEATRLLEESYALGSEGGPVDYMAARYVTGALIKAAAGDRDSAAERLSDGMRAAQNLQLPRLAARITNERIRLGIPIASADAARLRSPRTIPHDNGIATAIAELDEDSGVRLLSASDSPAERADACERASQLVAGIDGNKRPWAALRARLLLVETLAAAGRVAESEVEARPVVAKCTELGLIRLLVDAGLA